MPANTKYDETGNPTHATSRFPSAPGRGAMALGNRLKCSLMRTPNRPPPVLVIVKNMAIGGGEGTPRGNDALKCNTCPRRCTFHYGSRCRRTTPKGSLFVVSNRLPRGKMKRTVSFVNCSIGVPALLPCAMLLRQAMRTDMKTVYKTYCAFNFVS